MPRARLRLRSLALPFALVAAAVASGCLAPRQETTEAPRFAWAGPDGEMTATEASQERDGLNPGVPPLFFAERAVTVEGVLTFDRLPIDLAATNGLVEVRPGVDGAWRLVATLTGYGLTPETARSELDRLTFEWSHVDDRGNHFVHAIAKTESEGQSDVVGWVGNSRGDLVLELPPALLVTLAASSTNGNVVLRDLAADVATLSSTNGAVEVDGARVWTLAAESTNGNVRGEASGTSSVTVSTTNGNVDLTIHPAASGVVTASSTNGNLNLRVPEDREHGYRATLSTVNGKAEVGLDDGTASADEDGKGATFTTDGFALRDVRVDVTLSSVNGNVRLGPS